MSQGIPRNRTLSGSLPLLSFRGIGLFVHWSFLLIVGFVIYSGVQEGLGRDMILARLFQLLLVFVCVILHEFGHALTAQHYGIRTRDITLLPIGGVASLERMPEEPIKEFMITINGPLVNLGLVALTGAANYLIIGDFMRMEDLMFERLSVSAVLSFLLVINLGLFLFNLLPAFPMDGGRILRSLLAMRMERVRATQIASWVGRVFAMLFVVWGFFGNPFMILIGVFVYVGAAREARYVSTQAALRRVRVVDAMRTNFNAVNASSTIGEAVDALLAGADKDMLVVDGRRFKGILTRTALLQALRNGNDARLVTEIMLTGVTPISPEHDLEEAHRMLVTGPWPIIPVVLNDEVVGMLEPDNVAEYIMVKQARSFKN